MAISLPSCSSGQSGVLSVFCMSCMFCVISLVVTNKTSKGMSDQAENRKSLILYTADSDCSHEIKKLLTPWKESYDQPR